MQNPPLYNPLTNKRAAPTTPPTPLPKALVSPLPNDQAHAIGKAVRPFAIPGGSETGTGYGKLNQIYFRGHENSPWNALSSGQSLEGYLINATMKSFFDEIDGRESQLTQITASMRSGDGIDICVTMPGSGFPGINIGEKFRIVQYSNEIKYGKVHDSKLNDPSSPIKALAAHPLKRFMHGRSR